MIIEIKKEKTEIFKKSSKLDFRVKEIRLLLQHLIVTINFNAGERNSIINKQLQNLEIHLSSRKIAKLDRDRNFIKI